MATIFMLAPAPNMVFGPTPSGSSYQANQYGLIFTSSTADQVALMQAGCATLTPFSAYQLPPFTAWKLGATGCQVTSATQLNLTVYENKVGMFVRSHWATCQMSGAVILAYCNFSNWLNIGDYFDNGTEGYGTIIGTCSVAYPTKANVIGTGTFTVQPGGTAQVLIELSETIPRGAQFFVATYAVPAAGCGIPVFQAQYYTNIIGTAANFYNLAAGEAAEYATSGITDKTAAPNTVGQASPATTFIWGPSAILAVQPVTQPVVTVWGDSKETGFKIEPDAYGNIGPIAQAFGVSTPAITFGCSGKQALVDAGAGFSGTGYATAMSGRLAFAQLIGATHAINDYGRNDAAASLSAATIEAYLNTIGSRQAALGLVPSLVTQPPETTSTDVWATTTNQTRVAWQSVIDTLNTWMRAIPAPFTVTIDVMAAVGTALTGGVWTPLWTPEGVHACQPAVPAIVGQVPLAKFAGVVPALALAYGDTYALGLKNVQTALDVLLGQAGTTGVTTLTAADHTFAPYSDGRTFRDTVTLTGDQKLILATSSGAVSVPDGYTVKLSRTGSSGGHNRKVYQSDGSTLILSVVDGASASFTYSTAATAWFQSG
jgi:hypothetical protein